MFKPDEKWKLTGIREYPGGKREYKIFGKLFEIATIPINPNSDGTDELERANLFMGARDLLEACKAIVSLITGGSKYPEYWPNVKKDPESYTLKMVESAIARAEGKEPT